MERILVVLDDARAGAEALRILRAATGTPMAALVSRIRARLPVLEALLSGNDHDAQAARLVDALDALAAAGVVATLHEADDDTPFDAMPDAWRAGCVLPRSVLDNRLAARETESHRIAMLTEIERFAPEDPPVEIMPLEALAPDGCTATLRVEAATLPPWRLRLVADPDTRDLPESIAAALPLAAEREDLFEALAAVRAALEPRGVRLLCQGARRDVHPSPMARQAGGRLAYVISPGRPARREDLVDVLGPLAPDERDRVGTVAEQAEQARRWAASIAALPG